MQRQRLARAAVQHGTDMPGDGERARVLGIEHDGAGRQPGGFDDDRGRVAGPGLQEQDDVPAGQPGVRGRVVGLLRDRPAQQVAGLHELRPVEPRHQREGAQHQVVGGGVAGRAGGGALRLDQADLGVDARRHLGRHVVLQRQQVGHVAVEPVRPHDLVAGAQVEQAQRHAQALGQPAGSCRRAGSRCWRRAGSPPRRGSARRTARASWPTPGTSSGTAPVPR